MIANAQNIKTLSQALLRCYVLVLSYSLFCTNHVALADSKIDSSKLFLSTENALRCVHKKDNVDLGCTLSQNNANKSTDWNIVWRSEGKVIEQNSTKVFRNSTAVTSILTVYVNWTTNRVFTCLAEGDPTMNASITLGMMPQQTTIQGVRFIEGSDEKIVEVYWKPHQGCNYTYGLTYTIEEDFFGSKVYEINDVECYNRISDVYRVPDTTGYICKGSIKGASFQEYQEYRAQVNTVNGQCQIAGPISKFVLSSFGRDHGPNQNNIILIPLPVSKLNVSVARHQVKLTWQNQKSMINNRWYQVTFNCSGSAVKEEPIDKKTEKTLYNSDFTNYRPHKPCTFCIRVYLEASNVSSLPFCRKARLHEEEPSKPPKITCKDHECATTNDEHFRNVTITWSLPPRETWNGVLTRIVVLYHRAGNESGRRKSITERNITRGFTVLRMLARSNRYIVRAMVCNKEGCSDYGNVTVLDAKVPLVQPNESKSDESTGTDLTFLQWLGIGSVFVLVIVMVVCVWCVKKRSTDQLKKDNSLPSLSEPKSPDYDNVPGVPTDKEYDSLDGNSQETIA